MSKRYLLPLLFLALFTPFSSKLDLQTAQFFFEKTHFISTPFFDFVFHYAVYPAFAVGFLALALWIFSFFIPALKKWNSSCTVLVLSLALGAGFIVHTLLKDRWGRPRPRQIEQFGGHQAYRPYYLPNFSNPEPSKSFPCGHCTMGFYFFAVALLFQRFSWKKMAIFSYAGAVGLGLLLGVTRMAQGGHFLSDVFVSALIMWLVASLLERRFST